MPSNKTSAEDQTVDFRPEFIQTPGIVAFDPELQPLDSMVYSLVYWLERLKDGKCYASNKTLAKIAMSSPSGVAHSLQRLRDRGYIACVYDDNGQRKQIITLVHNTVNPISNEQGGVAQMSNRKNNTKKEDIMSDLTDQRKSEIRKIYKLWLIHTAVDQITRFGGTKEEKKEALAAAEKSYRLTEPRKAAINRRLDDAGYEQLVRAIKAISASPFHMGDNDRGWKADINFLCRSYEKVEEWANKNKREVQ